MADLVLSCLESRVEDNRNLYARFLVGPFLKGEALTVATALRRVLLSSIESIGITALYIQGITHEFSTIIGVRESVLELSLNFQAIVLSYDKTFFQKKSFFDTIQIGYLQVQGPKVIYANSLKLPLGVKLVDPTQYIATVSKEGSIVLKFIIGKRMPSLHQNTGPESHFGDRARDFPIIGEVGKKNIDRAKKTCFYKKAFTIKEKTKSFASLGRRMIFRSNRKMYAKVCPLKNKKNSLKKESLSFNKSSCVQSSAFCTPLYHILTCKASRTSPSFFIARDTNQRVHAPTYKSRARVTSTNLLAKRSFALVSRVHAPTYKSPICMRIKSKILTCMQSIPLLPLKERYERYALVSKFAPVRFAPTCRARRILMPCAYAHGMGIHSTTSNGVSGGETQNSKASQYTQANALQIQAKEKNKDLYVHNEKSTKKYKLTNYLANKAEISLAKLSVKRNSSFQREIKYKILRCSTYNSQILSFYKTKQRFLRFVFRKSEILSFFSRMCVPIYEKGLTNSSSLPKTKRIFRRRKFFFQKYKGEDKNDLKEKKFSFLSKNKIFLSNICLRNIIPLDFTLTPVLKVNFVIEIDDEVLYLRQKVRERIILEVWTNGSTHPRQAFHDAALSLTDIFASFRSLYEGASYS